MGESHEDRLKRIMAGPEPVTRKPAKRLPQQPVAGVVWVLHEVAGAALAEVLGVYFTADSAEKGAQQYIEAMTWTGRQWTVDEWFNGEVWDEFGSMGTPEDASGYGWSDGWKRRIRCIREEVQP